VKGIGAVCTTEVKRPDMCRGKRGRAVVRIARFVLFIIVAFMTSLLASNVDIAGRDS